MTGAWAMKPTTRILWPQGHSNGSTSYTRRISRAHDFRRAVSQALSCRGGSGGSSSGGNREEDFALARDPAVGVRVGAVVVDEMRSPVGDVRGETGDPLQVVVVPVAGGCPLFSVIGDGSLGKVRNQACKAGSVRQTSINFSSPSFSRLQASLSPGLSQTCLSLGCPEITPSGVPVKMMSPGLSVM
jgi:hypothetical protein